MRFLSENYGAVFSDIWFEIDLIIWFEFKLDISKGSLNKGS